MELKKLIKLQNAIIRAHQKINDVQNSSDNQTKELQNEINSLTKTLEQLNNELNSFTKKEEVDKQNIELERLKLTLGELNTSLDKRISSIQLKHGKDGINGKDGKDGKHGKDGKNGKDGLNGRDGKDGCNGLSAYEIAVKQGYEGTEKEWIEHITNNGGKNYSGQIAAIRGKINELEGKIAPGTEDVLTKASILQTIEECEQCQGEQVPAANLMAMTYNSIPRVVSEVENDVGYINEETDPVFTNSVAYNITADDINKWNNNKGIEYKATDNIVIEDEKIKFVTNTGYEVSDKDIQLQPISPSGTVGTNKIVYTDKEVEVIYDGTAKIRRSKNGINFNTIQLPCTCKSLVYNSDGNRLYGTDGNNYIIYSEDDGLTWKTIASSHAKNIDFLNIGYGTGFRAIYKSLKKVTNFSFNTAGTISVNSSITSKITPEFVAMINNTQFVWCNSSGTFKYGAGSNEGAFASLSGITVNILKRVNNITFLGLKNNNKLYLLEVANSVRDYKWVEYTLPNTCTVNDIIYNPYTETYYIFTNINTYYKTKDFVEFENIDNGLKGLQGHFTLMGIQMTTIEHDKLLLAPTRTTQEDKNQEFDRALNKDRWVGPGLQRIGEEQIGVKSTSSSIGVNDSGIFLINVEEHHIPLDLLEGIYAGKAEIKYFDPYEIENWYYNEGYPEDSAYACCKFIFNQAGSFLNMVTWDEEYMVEQYDYGYLFYDQAMNIFKYVKLGNLAWLINKGE